MKADVHPNYNKQVKVSCVCGNTFTTGSTLPEIKVDICSACHPFFTGQQKFIDAQGQVEKFSKFKKVSQVKKVERAKIEASRAEKQQKKSPSDKPSLKDLLLQARKKS